MSLKRDLVEAAVFNTAPTLKLEIDEEEAWLQVRRAIIKITEENPFYGELLAGLDIKTGRAAMAGPLSRGIKTACVYIPVGGEGIGLAVDPIFFDRLAERQREGVLLHELLHLALDHLGRGGQFKDKYRGNVAADMSVNQYIGKERLWIKPAPILPDTYKDRDLDLPENGTFEQYYDWLAPLFEKEKKEEDEKSDEEQTPQDVFGEGMVLDTPSGPKRVSELRTLDKVSFYNENKKRVDVATISMVEDVGEVDVIVVSLASGKQIAVGPAMATLLKGNGAEFKAAQLVEALMAGVTTLTSWNGKKLDESEKVVSVDVEKRKGYRVTITGLEEWLLCDGIPLTVFQQHGGGGGGGGGGENREPLSPEELEELRQILENAPEDEFEEVLAYVRRLRGQS